MFLSLSLSLSYSLSRSYRLVSHSVALFLRTEIRDRSCVYWIVPYRRAISEIRLIRSISFLSRHLFNVFFLSSVYACDECTLLAQNFNSHRSRNVVLSWCLVTRGDRPKKTLILQITITKCLRCLVTKKKGYSKNYKNRFGRIHL